MMVKQELLSRIRDHFDLNLYEVKIWLALLAKGVASAGELASISGVPRSRTYDILESLEKKGFVIAKMNKPIKYLGVKPYLVIEKLKNNVRKDAQERIFDLSNLKGTNEFSQIEAIYTNGIDIIKKEDLSVALRGRANISNHLKDILKNAKKEVIVCVDAYDLTNKIKLFTQTFESLKKRNIKIKMALLGEEKLIKQLETKLGLKIKQTEINAKFFIIDRKEILFYLSKGPENEEIAIWLNSDFFSQAFAILVDNALKD